MFNTQPTGMVVSRRYVHGGSCQLCCSGLLCEEDSVKRSCSHCQYGSFEHMLFLFCLFVCLTW